MNTEEMERLQKLEKIVKEGLSHPKASAQTIAMVGEVKDLLTDHIKKNSDSMDEHFKSDLLFQAKTEEAMQQLNELMPIIKEELIPAYKKQMKKEEAKKILKEEFEGWGFWGKTWLLWVAVVASIGTIIRIYFFK